MSHNEYLKEKAIEINYPSPYLHFAQDSRYLYVYVTKSFGWGIYPDFDAVILYDSTTGIAKYAGWSEKPIRRELFIRRPDLKDKFPQPKFIEKGEVNYIGNDVINSMFDCNPPIISYICDATNYYIFMKSGERQRYLCIQSGQENLFEPFIWLLDIVDTKY